MDKLDGHYFEDLKIGMSASYGKTITDADIIMFAGVSGDTNPLHLNAEYAETTQFGCRIAHGMLSASFISTIFGTKLPGPGCIYMSQNLRFKGPVKVGETVIATATVTELVPEKKRAMFLTQCTVGGKVVVDGDALIMVPSRG